MGLIGENGAGKSTLIKLLLGVTPSDGGEIRVFGQEALTPRLRERIGVAFDQCWFSDALNLRDVEAILRGLYPRAWNTEMFFALADRLGLGAKQKIAEYSSGMKAKLGILSAVCHAPDLLVLDEPTNALDEDGVALLERIIGEERERGVALLVSSHDASFIDAVATRVYHMAFGKVRNAEERGQV